MLSPGIEGGGEKLSNAAEKPPSLEGPTTFVRCTVLQFRDVTPHPSIGVLCQVTGLVVTYVSR